MMGMKRIVLFTFVWLLGFASVGLAQRQDTIYQTLATNYTTPNAATGDIWGPVTNIGQGYHQAYLLLSNQSGQTCLTGSSLQAQPLSANFYTYDIISSTYSPILTTQIFNQANIFPIGSARFGVLSQATSIFPFIYIKILGVNPVKCKYSLIYTGSLYPPPPFNQLQSGNTVSGQTGFGSFPSSIITITTNTTTSILTAQNTAEKEYLDVYGWTINSSAANQSVQIKCNGSIVLEEFDGLQAGQTIVMPFTQNAYDICNTSVGDGGITAVTTGITGKLTINAYYKHE